MLPLHHCGPFCFAHDWTKDNCGGIVEVGFIYTVKVVQAGVSFSGKGYVNLPRENVRYLDVQGV